MKKDSKAMIIGLDAATWTLVRRPGRTAQAVTSRRGSTKIEERLQALGYLE